MKKLILTLSLLPALAYGAFSFDFNQTYTHNTSFWKTSSSLSFRPVYALTIGTEFDVSEHKRFDNNVYALRLPIGVRFWDAGVVLTPFWYPDNGNGARAYGGKIMATSSVSRDEVEGSASQAYVSLGFASQKADLVKNGVLNPKQDFYQLAYELGANYDFFGTYSFDLTGNVFQYLSGIEGVKELRGVMSQQELANLGTIDHVLALPRGSAGIRIKWISAVNKSENYISYKYIDSYTNNATHSLLVGSNLRLMEYAYLNISYNHLFEKGRNRDLYGAGIMLRF